MHTPEQRHRRYQQQAGWTVALQQYLIAALKLNAVHIILEVGSGTGAASQSLSKHFQTSSRIAPYFYGVDLRLEDLTYSQTIHPDHQSICADGLALPFSENTFEASFCHFLLMWLADPLQGLDEMRRVTQPGGPVIAFAEPDYGGRIDYPPSLAELGKLQTRSLRAQGANPETGRKLAHLFNHAGLDHVHTGVLGGEWTATRSEQDSDVEWDTLLADLSGQASQKQLEDLQRVDQEAWQRGERVLYVPTFYCWGLVPD